MHRAPTQRISRRSRIFLALSAFLLIVLGGGLAASAATAEKNANVGLESNLTWHLCVKPDGTIRANTNTANWPTNKCLPGEHQLHFPLATLSGGGGTPPVTNYGVALVKISRGGATAATWETVSTALGGPADIASGNFRMSCSAAQAPCKITVQSYATKTGVKVYPRLDITKQNFDTGAAEGNCEYADGVNNDGGSVSVGNGAANITDVPLGIGGSLDCGSAQAYPTGGIADEIDVPVGRYDFATTFSFSG